MQWSPRVKISFSHEELIVNLVATRDCPHRRIGNWWTFFNHLCRHEQSNLLAECSRRCSDGRAAPPAATDSSIRDNECAGSDADFGDPIPFRRQTTWY